ITGILGCPFKSKGTEMGANRTFGNKAKNLNLAVSPCEEIAPQNQKFRDFGSRLALIKARMAEQIIFH
ncbi:MAG: hypothetical protein RSC51_05490, partial [Oscillospiraceae bacterium]